MHTRGKYFGLTILLKMTLSLETPTKVFAKAKKCSDHDSDEVEMAERGKKQISKVFAETEFLASRCKTSLSDHNNSWQPGLL